MRSSQRVTWMVGATFLVLTSCATNHDGWNGGHDAVAQPDTGGASDVAGDAPDAPGEVWSAPGHTDNQNGVMHKTGKNDPLTNCVGCHGAQLKGDAGPSCYSCHDSGDHKVNREGTLHRAGTDATCTACHGPANGGGLGPACATCHGSGD